MMKLLLACVIAFAAIAPDAVAEIADSDIIRGIAKPWQYTYQTAATPVMERLSGLHTYVFYVIVAITLFVTALLAYVCVRFRRSKNDTPSKTTHNVMLEIAWISIPVLILASIFVPSWKLHYYMDKVEEPDITLKVTGYQWYWGYSYPELGVDEYLSYMKPEEELKTGEPRLLSVDNALVVPVDQNVRVLLTAADVMHSFAMPAFGVKTDCIPGRLNETWFRATKPGIYYGQCSELCGVKHGFMPIEIRVVEQDVFDNWIERAKEGDFALDGLSIPTNPQVATFELQQGLQQ